MYIGQRRTLHVYIECTDYQKVCKRTVLSAMLRKKQSFLFLIKTTFIDLTKTIYHSEIYIIKAELTQKETLIYNVEIL